MIAIPYGCTAETFSVFVILQDDNLARIKSYDPAALTINKLPRTYDGLRLVEVNIGYATESEVEELMEMATTSGIEAILKKLSRGFKYKPDAGDHDGPYEGARRSDQA